MSVLMACSKDDGVDTIPETSQEQTETPPDPVGETPEEAEQAPAEVDEVTPLNGPKGTIVTIKGSNFGSDTEEVEVSFNGKAGRIIRLEDSIIEVEVPVLAMSGDILLTTANTSVVAGVFSYELSTVVQTFAGGEDGFSDGALTEAVFDSPMSMVTDVNGNIYLVDRENHRIRKITPEGQVSTLAGGTQGNADGFGVEARFDHPVDIAIGTDGTLYVTDNQNHQIRRISAEGEVTTIAGGSYGFADGNGMEAKFRSPRGITVDMQGNLYVTDSNNNRIRKITPEGDVTTLAGKNAGSQDGSASEATFNRPTDIIMYGPERMLVADTENHRIRIMTVDGATATLAGSVPGYLDGSLSEAQFLFPGSLFMNASGEVFVADTYNHKIRKIVQEGTVSTVAGSNSGYSDGLAEEAQFNTPMGLVEDSNGDLLVIDNGNHKIRKITQE